MQRIMVLAGLFAALTAHTTSATQPEYQVIDLGQGSELVSVDPHGIGVGSWQGQAALFYLDGSHVLLDTLPGAAFAEASARDGVHGTVGSVSFNPPDSPTITHAFYRFGGIMRDLGTLTGDQPFPLIAL